MEYGVGYTSSVYALHGLSGDGIHNSAFKPLRSKKNMEPGKGSKAAILSIQGLF